MKISDIFDVSYGINLELNKCDITNDRDGINFVSRTSQNNGIVAKVKRIEGKEPQPAGVLTCAGGGSVLSTFVQTEPFYSGRDLYILTPKKNLTLNEKLYYAMCIKENAYRYNYGRQANKTLKDIEIPDNIPDWVYSKNINYNILKSNINKNNDIPLNTETWKDFKIGDLFFIQRGKRLKEEDREPGNIKYFSASELDNGLTDKISNPLFTESNALIYTTFGTCFYIESLFTASDEISILKHENLNKYNGLFIATVINKNKYKYQFGRKAFRNKFEFESIKLPIDDKGNPDWLFMENYIKSLPYSDKI